MVRESDVTYVLMSFLLAGLIIALEHQWARADAAEAEYGRCLDVMTETALHVKEALESGSNEL